MTKAKPVCVLISDIHYNLTNLPLADASLKMAVAKAASFKVPLIIAGDAHDTKANIRAECVKAMRETLSEYAHESIANLRGNHCSWHEKSTETALDFLSDLASIIKVPYHWQALGLYLVPYHHDPDELRRYLKTIPKGSTLIMHQGIQSANGGDYFQDKSAIFKKDVADFRVISGHYHQRQDITCGELREGQVGLSTYLGSPYTQSFGEANDGPKGFGVLMSDGTLEFVPTNLRKHIIWNIQAPIYDFATTEVNDADLLWVKLSGTMEWLSGYTKEVVANALGLKNTNFKLDLISLDSGSNIEVSSINKTETEVVVDLIDSMANTSEDKKTRLKDLWSSL